MTGALAALDIALWDLKGKMLGPADLQAARRRLADRGCRSTPRSAATRRAASTRWSAVVEQRWRAETPAAIKIRWDGDRTRQDDDIPGDIAKAKAVRKLVGDDFPFAFDANNHYSVGGAIRVGRALEELGYIWFEEPVQHYDVRAMGEVAQRLDITVSAGEQTYTTAGARRPDQRRRAHGAARHRQDGRHHRAACSARRSASRTAVELVPHQTQPAHRPRRQPARAGDADAQHQAGRVRRPATPGCTRVSRTRRSRGTAASR